MILYKNVDICDLESIMKNGVLSMDECGNDNWDEGHRADNDTSVVYLFSPIKKGDSFPKYGVALLEINCAANKNEMSDNDIHKDEYIEYITDRVLPMEIKRIIIPELFREYINIPNDLKVTWCGLKADYYNEHNKINASIDVLKQFAKTAPLESTEEYCFFRGKYAKTMGGSGVMDLYNVQYVF